MKYMKDKNLTNLSLMSRNILSLPMSTKPLNMTQSLFPQIILFQTTSQYALLMIMVHRILLRLLLSYLVPMVEDPSLASIIEIHMEKRTSLSQVKDIAVLDHVTEVHPIDLVVIQLVLADHMVNLLKVLLVPDRVLLVLEKVLTAMDRLPLVIEEIQPKITGQDQIVVDSIHTKDRKK